MAAGATQGQKLGLPRLYHGGLRFCLYFLADVPEFVGDLNHFGHFRFYFSGIPALDQNVCEFVLHLAPLADSPTALIFADDLNFDHLHAFGVHAPW